MSSVLVVSPMSIESQRTGPGMRVLELARVLGADSRVTLLLPNQSPITHCNFAVRTRSDSSIEALADTHEIVMVQGPALQEQPELVQVLGRGRHYLVVDLYDPITLELLEVDREGRIGRCVRREYTALLNEQLRLGDFFICASDRQRDYWIGALSSLGRINHDTYDGAKLRQLIDVVPFGLPAKEPRAGGPVLKGVLPGIAPSDRVILWGGGIWDWLDPLTPIRAMRRLAEQHADARLVFFEWAHHQPGKHREARQLADELSLLDRHVFFVPWLPPAQWESCLLEADVGLVFHPPSIETHFAFRTRLLDYVWAGLPIVTAAGDVMSDLVAARELGFVVGPGDEEGLARALGSMLDEADARGSRRARFQAIARACVWEEAAKPLLRYCRQPWHAGDRETSFARNWEAAEQDRRQSAAAHAERLTLEAERLHAGSEPSVPEPGGQPASDGPQIQVTTESTGRRSRERVRSVFQSVRRRIGSSQPALVDSAQEANGDDRQ